MGMLLKKQPIYVSFLLDSGVATDVEIATFGSVIGTHLGEGSIALGYIPIV